MRLATSQLPESASLTAVIATVRFVKFGCISALILIAAACSSSSSDDGATNDDGGGTTEDDGGATTIRDAGKGTSLDSGAKITDSGSSGGDSGSGVVVDSGDGFSASRAACVNEINRLRATQGHAALVLWTSPSVDMCVDHQATSDETNSSPHQAWNKHTDACDGNGQDECEGAGTSPAGIVSCLDNMWGEKDQPSCSGCAACSGAYNPACPNCDFFGTKGAACGHYVNMSADYFSEVACGFSALGGWATQNFQ